MFACVAEINQGVDVAVGRSKDATAFATIAAVWATLWDEFLAAKAMRTIAAFPSNDFNSGFVDEFHFSVSGKQNPGRGRGSTGSELLKSSLRQPAARC
jgi:hypothetical protein